MLSPGCLVEGPGNLSTEMWEMDVQQVNLMLIGRKLCSDHMDKCPTGLIVPSSNNHMNPGYFTLVAIDLKP